MQLLVKFELDRGCKLWVAVQEKGFDDKRKDGAETSAEVRLHVRIG